MAYASDVVPFDDWDSGKLGTESLDVRQLLRDVAFEETNVRRGVEAAGDVRESGWDWNATSDILFGAGAGTFAAIGFIPASALKAGRGAARAFGMLGSLDYASRASRLDEVAAARRALNRQGLKLSDEGLQAGVDGAVSRLGYWREPGVLPEKWTAASASGEVATKDLEAGRIRLFHGVSPTPSRGNELVDDTLRSIMDEGLVAGKGSTDGSIYADQRFWVARSYGIGDRENSLMRVVAEFVADPAKMKVRDGYPIFSSVPKSDIAAFHLTNPAGDIIASKAVNGDLGSVLSDVGAARFADGGFTWNPRTNNFEFTEGYSLGVSPLHTVTVPVDEFAGKDLLDFLGHKGYGQKTVARLLAEDPSKMVGGWVEDGLVYLDVSKIFDDSDEVLAVGNRLGEIAAWDFAKFEPIYMTEKLSPFARAAIAGGAEEDLSLLQGIRASGLEDFFTGKIGSAELRPELTPIFFGEMTTGQKKWLAKELLKEAPLRKYTADDFKTDIVRQWVAREQEYLKGLNRSVTRNLGNRSFKSPVKVDGKAVYDDEGKLVRKAKQIPDRTKAPLVDFFEEFGLSAVPLSSAGGTRMHRKITKAIMKGDVDAVAEVFAAQANNLARFVGRDALTPNFYPYMAYMTVMNAKRMHPAGLAPVLAVSSAQVGPGGESGRALRAMERLAENKLESRNFGTKKAPDFRKTRLYEIVDGRAVWTAPNSTGYEVNVMKAALEMINNPDWMMSQVPGLSVKTYVYALLKLNPRISRALVVDTVDMQMRFATRMAPGWDVSKGGEMTEIALNQFVSRVMATSMDVPAFSLQENGWATFRAIRDRFSGTPKSLTYKDQPLGAVYSQIGLPSDLGALYQKNYKRLLDQVRAGEVTHWREVSKGVLVPADDIPVEMLLPPAVRAKPGYVERFKDMISSAEEMGRILKGGQ